MKLFPFSRDNFSSRFTAHSWKKGHIPANKAVRFMQVPLVSSVHVKGKRKIHNSLKYIAIPSSCEKC